MQHVICDHHCCGWGWQELTIVNKGHVARINLRLSSNLVLKMYRQYRFWA